ncbi:hypothetical protein GHT06_003778 [Daphnia sinensis]|uniref:Bacteriophage T5 Orf172 DNA-binding domain-containing protein n=1 Tax=Daphnia sinensis TaxID=1820382 RepID=A0AAD5KES5_9CRUS|nr:hypothetical protein GHT06_003778 [Daphnia sinensis]
MVKREEAVNGNPEALAAVKRAEEAERTEQAKRDRVIAEEQAKRDTIDKEMESARATVQSLRAMHADLQGLNDVRFLAWRQLNINRSILAAAGPCVYALFAQGYVKIGHTGTSLFERYKRDLWSHDMKELILICVPHKHKDEAYRHERLIHTQLKQIRCRVGNALEKFAMDFGRVSDAFKAVYGEEDIKFV